MLGSESPISVVLLPISPLTSSTSPYILVFTQFPVHVFEQLPVHDMLHNRAHTSQLVVGILSSPYLEYILGVTLLKFTK